jgi:hypothetical protein
MGMHDEHDQERGAGFAIPLSPGLENALNAYVAGLLANADLSPFDILEAPLADPVS